MPTRRTFLLTTGTMIAGSSAAAFAVNEAIRIAVVGCGGRARHLLQSLLKLPNISLDCLCDVWDGALVETRKLAPQAASTRDQKSVWENKNIDAVLIGSPDHWHAPMTIAACEAGKDVYVEKPLTHKRFDGQKLIDTVAATKRIVQVGMQQRSMPHIHEAKTMVDSGTLGKILKVTMSWNRNSSRVKKQTYGIRPESVDWKGFLGSAPEQPFDEFRMRQWRWFWDFGGGLFTDLMVHWVDVAHWLTGVDSPMKAVSIGQHFGAKGIWETPDTVQTLLTYPNDIQMHYEGTFSNARRGSHIEIMGTDATLYVDRGRYELMPERGRSIQPVNRVIGKNPATPGADFYDQPDGEKLHLQNWLDCIRSRKEPTAPVRVGVSAANAAHLANHALRGNGVAEI